MSNSIEVFLPPLDAVVRLVGDAGATIDQSSAVPVLVGDYRLVLKVLGRTIVSRAMKFGPDQLAGEVRRQSGRWELAFSSRATFGFDAPVILSSGPRCPTLTFQQVVLQKFDGSTTALLDLADMSLSLRPRHSPESAGSIVYPTKDGWREESITPGGHPDVPGVLGFFLQLDAEGEVAVVAGAPLGGLDIDHGKATRLFTTINCLLSYQLETNGRGQDGCLRLTSLQDLALRVGVDWDTGLAVADGGPGIGNQTWSGLERIEARAGRFANTRFSDPQARMRRVSDGAAPMDAAPQGETAFFGPGARFDFELEIPEDSFFDPAHHRTAFIYRHDTGDEAIADEDPWERFYGMTIAGVHSTRGRPEIFDLTLGEINLGAGGAGAPNGRFDFAAGGEIDDLGTSIVRPKPDRTRGHRSAALATDALNLTLSEKDPTTPKTCLEYRSLTSSISFVDPKLEGPPAGATAREVVEPESSLDDSQSAPKDPGKFSAWVMDLPEQDGQSGRLDFSIDQDSLSPPLSWLDTFRTKEKQFEMLEIPGIKVTTNGSVSNDQDQTEKTGTTVDIDFEWPGDTKKTAVYSAASLVAAWALIPKGISENLDEFRDKAEDFFDTNNVKVDFDFKKMSPGDLQKFVRSRAPDSMQLGFYTENVGDAGDMQMRSFIDANGGVGKIPSNEKEIKKLYFPLVQGLGIVLMDHGPDNQGNKRYASQIVLDQASDDPDAPALRPSMLFKLGQKGIKKSAAGQERLATDYRLLGYTEAQWQQLAREQPVLWPRAADANAGRPDPTDERWFGMFFRDMPVQLIAPPKVAEAIRKRSKLLQKVYEIINANLYMRYGWLGPSGPTWYVGLLNQQGYDVTPNGWEDHISFRLERLAIAGVEKKPAGAEAAITLALKKITDSDNKPLTIQGRFSLDVSKSDPITAFELAVTNETILETNAIPGFDEIALVGMASDLKTATLRLRLTPSDGLAAALPIFEAGESVIASMVLNFTGQPATNFQLALPTDAETKLFGRFPLVIQGVYLKLGDANGQRDNVLLVRGRLGLGLAGLDAVGADVILRQTADGWDFDVFINEIGVSLEVGDDFKMQGLLSWAPDDVPIGEIFPDPNNPEPYQRAVPEADVADQGHKRNFWAILSLTTGSFLGELSILLKIGSHGEKTYWVAAVTSSADIKLGKTVSFQDPAIVLAKNADFGAGLQELLLNPYADNVSGVRPQDGDLGKKREWLQKWKPSDKIGAVVAGSGYIHVNDAVAGSTKSDGERYMTGLIGTDAGLFRFDAYAKFLGTKIVGFGIAIDTRKKRLLVALRMPEIKAPTEQNPKYVLSPGTMAMMVNYGGKPEFMLSIGWPPLLPGSQIERDWNQATRVYIAELFPINTFWGGFKASATDRYITFGYAIRAGWTWTAELNGADIAKASAELGVTLGGVLEFYIDFGASPQALPLIEPDTLPSPVTAPQTSRGLARRDPTLFKQLKPDLAATILTSLDIMESATAFGIEDVGLQATVYGDIWGKGSLEFLGVTLASVEIALRLRVQFCGSLKRGVTRAWGRGEIEVRVTILCVTFTGRAGFDLWLKRGECHGPEMSSLAAPIPLLAPPNPESGNTR